MVTAVSTVLVIDSDVRVRSEIAAYLRDCGYRVIEVATGEEARQVFSAGEPVKIVLVDAQLPGTLDGFAFAQWMRTHQPHVGVILAGTVQRAIAAAGELCDQGPTLSRPYDPQIVADRIKQLLAGGS